MRRLLATLLMAGIAAPAAAQLSDAAQEEMKNWVEEKIALPAFPGERNLLEFQPRAGSATRFFIDGETLRVDPDGVVRFAMVVRSGSGASSTTWEGIRCATGERRLYATGRTDGTWQEAKSSAWRALPLTVPDNHYSSLYREYFCPGRGIVGRRADALAALRRGGAGRTGE